MCVNNETLSQVVHIRDVKRADIVRNSGFIHSLFCRQPVLYTVPSLQQTFNARILSRVSGLTAF